MPRNPGPQGGLRLSWRSIDLVERSSSGHPGLDMLKDGVADVVREESWTTFKGWRHLWHLDPDATNLELIATKGSIDGQNLAVAFEACGARLCDAPSRDGEVDDDVQRRAGRGIGEILGGRQIVGRPEASSSATRAAPRPQPPNRNCPGVTSRVSTSSRQCRSSSICSIPRNVRASTVRTLQG